MRKIGLIVNPIAGMGGSVGLKGTDGKIIEKARKLGAEPITPKRIEAFLSNLTTNIKITFLVAPRHMGEKYIKNYNVPFEVVGKIGKTTSAEDTKRIAEEMLEKGIELLVFCGGDGTARDVYDAIDLKIPVIGIPAGVKMFSSIFAINPDAAWNLLKSYLEGSELVENEVLDIDEEAFREDKLDSKLYGVLKIPKVKQFIQGGKKSSGKKRTEAQNKQLIAEAIREQMRENALYLLGPGTTVKAISEKLDIPISLLGIDAVYNRELLQKDINEQQILKLLKTYQKAYIIVSPIGGQGFIFGRGNKQFTPEVIKIVGKNNIIVVSTQEKLKELNCLRVDTGDIEIDKMLRGYIKVVIGLKEKELIEVK
ncbi:MAG: ATP-NAD kinase [Promethearchaeota archaeon]|nr:MAG: ATP-NAD kinase [Candidatus Lokiarchaeota archaeon]